MTALLNGRPSIPMTTPETEESDIASKRLLRLVREGSTTPWDADIGMVDWVTATILSSDRARMRRQARTNIENRSLQMFECCGRSKQGSWGRSLYHSARHRTSALNYQM